MVGVEEIVEEVAYDWKTGMVGEFWSRWRGMWG